MAKKEQGKKFRRKIISNSMILLCLVFAAVSATYSWFIYQKPNGTYLFDVNVEGVSHIKISELKEWADHEIDEDWRKNFTLKPITGDGELFFTPKIEQKEVEPNSGVYDNFPSETDFDPIPQNKLSNYIYRIDFNLHANGRGDLYFDYIEGKTFVAPSEYDNTSKYGEFSINNICSAVRIAVFQDNIIKSIWIPNSETELVVDGDRRELKEKGKVEDFYEFRHSILSGGSTVIKTDIDNDGVNEKSGYTVENNITYIWGDISPTNCPKIGALEYGVNKMSILVWLEGTDRECDISMSAGRINANICFTTAPTEKG